MLSNLKLHFALITIVGILSTATITAPFTKIFGKFYNVKKDFTCCKGENLIIHHYYTVNILWLEVADGYTEEKSIKVGLGGCAIHCSE